MWQSKNSSNQASTHVNRARRSGSGRIQPKASQFGVPLAAGGASPRRAPTVRDHSKRFLIAVILLLIAGTILLWLPWTDEPGVSTSLVDAFFTAVSAFAGTFAVLDTADHWNTFGEAVVLVLIQAGGLGFMVGASLILAVLRRGTSGPGLRDAVMIRDGSPALSLRDALHLSRRIVRFTFIAEAAGAILLTARFSADMPFGSAAWHGVFTSVSAFCNAGFDLNGGYRSLIPYQSSVAINFIVIALIQAGALSYLVWSDIVQSRRWNALAIDTRLILIGNGVLLVVGAVLFLLSEWNRTLRGQDLVTRLLASVFQSTSARSAGFQTVDLSQAKDVTLFAYTGLMFIGGAPGSTAGGIKLTVAGVIVAAILATLRGETETNLMKRRLPASVFARAVTITISMGVALFVVALALTITENRWGASPQFLHLLFDSASALGSVGLSSGITAGLSTAGKIVLSIAMVFGKVGPLTMAYALQRRQRAQRYSLPEANVRMG